MKYMHTMLRVPDLNQSLVFYRDALGLDVLSVRDFPGGRFTLAAPSKLQQRLKRLDLPIFKGVQAHHDGLFF